jgi:predicted RNA binding protein YcfA (HicA-like mRNA interferase family)
MPELRKVSGKEAIRVMERLGFRTGRIYKTSMNNLKVTTTLKS